MTTLTGTSTIHHPTSHLGMESIEAPSLALEDYEGTLIFVSHDREFVSSPANHTLETKDQSMISFQGAFEE